MILFGYSMLNYLSNRDFEVINFQNNTRSLTPGYGHKNNGRKMLLS